MERIGERLRRRREELGLTLDEVSGMIRYRPEIISAIEEGRTNVFPAEAYMSAFLRAYAVALELDPREIVREQKSEEERAFEAIRNIRAKPRRRRRFPRKVLYIGIPVALAVALVFVVDRVLWEGGQGTGGGAVEEGPAARVDVTVEAPGGAGADVGAPSADAGAADEAAGEGQAAAAGSTAAVEGRANESMNEGPDGAETPAAGSGGASEDSAAGREEPPEEGGAGGSMGARAEGMGGEAAETAGGDARGAVVEMPGTGPPGRHELVVSARRTAYIALSAGGRTVYDSIFAGGRADTFFSDTGFVVDFLNDPAAWTIVQDGETIPLPRTSGENLSRFEISPPSGDPR